MTTKRALGLIAKGRVGLPFAVLAYWFACKFLLYRHLEYTSDYFSFLQMTTSWRETGILLWENAYGRHYAVHNFYSMLLFYPLTSIFGGEGLFIGLLLLNAYAVWLLVRTRCMAGWSRATFCVAVLGPVGYWIFDHPGYGFHPELMYVPLSIILAIAVLENRRWLMVTAAALVCLTKEDGPLVCAAVFLAAILAPLFGSRPAAEGRKDIQKRTLRAIGLWGGIFFAGLVLLFLAGQVAGAAAPVQSTPRMSLAVRVLLSLPSGGYPGHLRNLGVSFAGLVALLLASVAASPRCAAAALPLSIVTAAPVVAAQVMAAAVYGFSLEHGLTWPPRFAPIWASVLSAMIFVASGQLKYFPRTSKRRVGLLMLVLGLIALGAQAAAVHIIRHYPLSRANIVSLISRPSVAAEFTRAEKAAIQCVAGSLPSRTPVLVPGSLFAWFDRETVIWPERLQTAWAPPRVAVCTAGVSLPAGFSCAPLPVTGPGWIMAKKDRVTFLSDAAHSDTLRKCVGSVGAVPTSAPASSPAGLALRGAAGPLKVVNEYPFKISATPDPAGEPALFAHPYAKFEAPVPPACTSFRVYFGMFDASWTHSPSADGVIFRISNEKGEVWSRHLNPRASPADRGLHSAAFHVARGGSGRLTFETTNADDAQWDHAYWSHIECVSH